MLSSPPFEWNVDEHIYLAARDMAAIWNLRIGVTGNQTVSVKQPDNWEGPESDYIQYYLTGVPDAAALMDQTGTLWLPARGITTLFEGTGVWDNATSTYTMDMFGYNATFTVGKKQVRVNEPEGYYNKEMPLSGAPFVWNDGRLYIQAADFDKVWGMKVTPHYDDHTLDLGHSYPKLHDWHLQSDNWHGGVESWSGHELESKWGKAQDDPVIATYTPHVCDRLARFNTHAYVQSAYCREHGRFTAVVARVFIPAATADFPFEGNSKFRGDGRTFSFLNGTHRSEQILLFDAVRQQGYWWKDTNVVTHNLSTGMLGTSHGKDLHLEDYLWQFSYDANARSYATMVSDKDVNPVPTVQAPIMVGGPDPTKGGFVEVSIPGPPILGINYRYKFRIDTDGTVSLVEGSHSKFPAYEIYVQYPGCPETSLTQFMHDPGATPVWLALTTTVEPATAHRCR